MAKYNNRSPYFSTLMTNGYLDVINFRDLPQETDDILFQITKNYEYRPDLLAFDLYGDVALWWVFAVRNKNIIEDPIFDMTAGTSIYLPKLTSLKSALGF